MLQGSKSYYTQDVLMTEGRQSIPVPPVPELSVNLYRCLCELSLGERLEGELTV